MATKTVRQQVQDHITTQGPDSMLAHLVEILAQKGLLTSSDVSALLGETIERGRGGGGRMKYEIKNRFTGRVQFIADIDDHEIDAYRKRFAVLWGLKEGADLQGANLLGANLRGANLLRANFRGANLRGANLLRADLRGADLRGANLLGADLRGANLRGADLQGADLRGANLYRANLQRANLYRADLRGANLYRANLQRANLYRADLRGADLQDGTYGAGIPLTQEPLQLLGLQYPIIIFDTHIKIGCELHTIDEWRAFSNSDIVRMDGKAALVWWQAYREIVLALAENHSMR